MRNILFIGMILQGLSFSGKGQDSLVCFEIISRTNLVQSAPLFVPAGTIASIDFESNNQSGELAFSQGFLVQLYGRSFVKYQAPTSYIDSYTNSDPALREIWRKRAFSNAISQYTGYQYAVSTGKYPGPCTISFFCTKSALRGAVYLQPDSAASAYYTNKLLTAAEGTFSIRLPANTLADIQDSEVYGPQKLVKNKVSGFGNRFSPTNRLNWPTNIWSRDSLQPSGPVMNTWLYSSSSGKTTNSRVVSWATVNWQSNGRSVWPLNFGPATITYTYTNRADTNSFTVLRYYISPANYSLSNSSYARADLVPWENAHPKPYVLVLEKSTDGKKWIQVQEATLTNTIQEATFRIRHKEI